MRASIAAGLSLLFLGCSDQTRRATTASLAVTIGGLPAGADADVTVAGPAGFSQHLTATQTLTGLAPGAYAISAQTVSSGGSGYAATVSGSPATLVAGQQASTSVTYAAASGSLAITVTGLPAAVDGDVTVSGPAGFSQHLTATQTLTGLAPGSYAVAAGDVAGGGSGYSAAVSGSPVAVSAGQQASASVTYSVAPATTGSLAVAVTGLPPGVSADVTVTGPGGFSQQLTGSQTLAALAPGSYTVTAQAVSSGATSYTPTVSGSPAGVVAGQNATASVAYTGVAATTGSLAVAVSGLPGGTGATIYVTGPSGYFQTLTGPQTLTGLVPGSYSVIDGGASSGGFDYQGTVTGSPATVSAGQTANASVAYAITGNLAVTITGGDANAHLHVTIAGPASFSTHPSTNSETLTGLADGSYTVTASSYTASGVLYSLVSITGSPASVVAGQEAPVTVTYQAPQPTVTSVVNGLGQPGNGRIDGGDTITVNGTDFAAGSTSVSFGTAAGTNVAVSTSSQLTVTSPAYAVGPVDVVVTTPGGSSAISSADRYDYWDVAWYPLPGAAVVGGMVVGPDGNVWFSEASLTDPAKVGKIAPDGGITEYPLPHSNSGPLAITVGADGNLWFADSIAFSQVGRVDTDGGITLFTAPTASCNIEGIAPGPGSTLWFTERCNNGGAQQVASITTAGPNTITEYPLATNASPFGIAQGADGNPWFAETGLKKIGTIDSGGTSTTFDAGIGGPLYVALGPDGNIWSTAVGNAVGVTAPDGGFSQHIILDTLADISNIAADSRGGVWYTTYSSIGFTDSTTFDNREYSLGHQNASGIVVGPDGAIWVLVERVPGAPFLTSAIGRFVR